MNLHYKWQLDIGEDTYDVHPVYKDDMSLEYDLESGQQFLRKKLTGKMSFLSGEAEMIINADYDTEFVLHLLVSGDGITYREYYLSHFYMTDCTFDLDDKKVTVQPSVKDRYNNILDGMEREFDLIKCGCVKSDLVYYERPIFQFYAEYETYVTCISGIMSYKRDCNSVNMATAVSKLFNEYTGYATFDVTNLNHMTGLSQPFIGRLNGGSPEIFRNDDNIYRIDTYIVTDAETPHVTVQMWRRSDEVMVAEYRHIGISEIPTDFTMWGQDGFPNLSIHYKEYHFAARFVCDSPSITFGSGVTVNMSDYPGDDIIENRNTNFNKCCPFSVSVIEYSTRVTDDPTEYGQQQSTGLYFLPPEIPTGEHRNYFPIGQDSWRNVSFWVRFEYNLNTHTTSSLDIQDWATEGRKAVILRDAYRLEDVLKTMLAQVAPEISFDGTIANSQFLYSNNRYLFMTPKSNVVTGEYQNAASKAPMTLQTLFSMLKNIFQCYWFIDEYSQLRVEHISWFKNGGSYTGQPSVSYDLTRMRNIRNGKVWGFDTSSWDYAKEEMPERYEFSFMDDGSYLFSDSPLVINSPLVKKDKKEEINIANFTTDLDYIIENPKDEVSPDGYVLFLSDYSAGSVTPQYITLDGKVYDVNNLKLSLYYMQKYYWNQDLPAYDYRYYGQDAVAEDISFKKQQKIQFPLRANFLNSDIDPDTFSLIRTPMGDGRIAKMSINLSSRTAKITLKYRTYEYDNEQ